MLDLLQGIRIISFNHFLLGPMGIQALADVGADVIAVETPEGAWQRHWSSGDIWHDGQGMVHMCTNRNKRSVALDLKSSKGKEIALKLIDGADVVAENFRPGVMDKLGFGYDALRRRKPSLVYASASGYGPEGPYAQRPGQDLLAQAMSGVMARKADPSHPMATYATALADYSAGMHMVQGVLLALLQRERSGEGQKISVSLYNSMLAMQMQEAAMILMRDKEVNWAAMPLSGVFKCADHPLVLVGAFKANPLRDICAALELPDLSLEARFANLEQQFAHKAELQGMFRERFRTRPRDHWLGRLEAQDLLCAPVRDMREVLVDPQTVHNAMVMEGPAAGGTRYRFVASPITMSAAPVTMSRLPPRLGEHTDEVLAEAAAGKTRGRP